MLPAAAQRHRRFDMGDRDAIVAAPVIRKGRQPIFDEFETMQRCVVGEIHRHGLVRSRYIQGSINPMGMIHSVPANM